MIYIYYLTTFYLQVAYICMQCIQSICSWLSRGLIYQLTYIFIYLHLFVYIIVFKSTNLPVLCICLSCLLFYPLIHPENTLILRFIYLAMVYLQSISIICPRSDILASIWLCFTVCLFIHASPIYLDLSIYLYPYPSMHLSRLVWVQPKPVDCSPETSLHTTCQLVQKYTSPCCSGHACTTNSNLLLSPADRIFFKSQS